MYLQAWHKHDTDFYVYNPSWLSVLLEDNKQSGSLSFEYFSLPEMREGTWERAGDISQVSSPGWVQKWYDTFRIFCFYGKHQLSHLYVYCIFLILLYEFNIYLSIFKMQRGNFHFKTNSYQHQTLWLCLFKRNYLSQPLNLQQILVLLPKYVYLESHKSFMSFLAIQLHHSPSQNMNTAIYVVGPYSNSTETFSFKDYHPW